MASMWAEVVLISVRYSSFVHWTRDFQIDTEKREEDLLSPGAVSKDVAHVEGCMVDVKEPGQENLFKDW